MTLGISGLGALASLADYRPYFLGVAFAALGYSHWVAYRHRRGARSGRTSGRHLGGPERWLWVTTAVVILLAVFPYINPYVSQ